MDILGKSLLVGGVVIAVGASIPIILGFGTAGVASGSIAAGIQSTIGNVAAGSLFAITQSAAASGTFVTAAVCGGAAAGTGAIIEATNNKEETAQGTESIIQPSNNK